MSRIKAGNFFWFLFKTILVHVNFAKSQCYMLNTPQTEVGRSFVLSPEEVLANKSNPLVYDCFSRPAALLQPVNGAENEYGLWRIPDNSGYEFYVMEKGSFGINAMYLPRGEILKFLIEMRHTWLQLQPFKVARFTSNEILQPMHWFFFITAEETRKPGTALKLAVLLELETEM